MALVFSPSFPHVLSSLFCMRTWFWGYNPPKLCFRPSNNRLRHLILRVVVPSCRGGPGGRDNHVPRELRGPSAVA
jgi:hypothetical protein